MYVFHMFNVISIGKKNNIKLNDRDQRTAKWKIKRKQQPKENPTSLM